LLFETGTFQRVTTLVFGAAHVLRGGIEQETTTCHLVVIQILADWPPVPGFYLNAARQSEQTPKRSRNPQGICQEAAKTCGNEEKFRKNENK
jgi:hypothetical protein